MLFYVYFENSRRRYDFKSTNGWEKYEYNSFIELYDSIIKPTLQSFSYQNSHGGYTEDVEVHFENIKIALRGEYNGYYCHCEDDDNCGCNHGGLHYVCHYDTPEMAKADGFEFNKYSPTRDWILLKGY